MHPSTVRRKHSFLWGMRPTVLDSVRKLLRLWDANIPVACATFLRNVSLIMMRDVNLSKWMFAFGNVEIVLVLQRLNVV